MQANYLIGSFVLACLFMLMGCTTITDSVAVEGELSAGSAPLSYPAPASSVTPMATNPTLIDELSTPTVPLAASEGHIVVIALSGFNDALVSCSAGHFKVNGHDPIDGIMPCTTITHIEINGNHHNNVFNLGGLRRVDFPLLQEIRVNGGGGNDQFTASEFKDVLIAGEGDDAFIGVSEDDVVEPGGGFDMYMEATDPLDDE